MTSALLKSRLGGFFIAFTTLIGFWNQFRGLAASCSTPTHPSSVHSQLRLTYEVAPSKVGFDPLVAFGERLDPFEHGDVDDSCRPLRNDRRH